MVDEDSDFVCYYRSDGKPVHVDGDKENAGSDEKNPTFASLPIKSEEDEIDNDDEIGVSSISLNGNISVLVYGDLRGKSDHENVWVA